MTVLLYYRKSLSLLSSFHCQFAIFTVIVLTCKKEDKKVKDKLSVLITYDDLMIMILGYGPCHKKNCHLPGFLQTSL